MMDHAHMYSDLKQYTCRGFAKEHFLDDQLNRRLTTFNFYILIIKAYMNTAALKTVMPVRVTL
jgi:TnpA family transposase